MGERFWNTAIVAAAAGLAGGFGAYFLTGWTFTEFRWCIAGEQHCVRDWIGALSGWAAAIAAALTIGVLWGQLREARRQSVFLLGDAMPTAEVKAADDGLAQIDLTVTNWNRRHVVIEDITAAEGCRIGGFDYKLNHMAIELRGEEAFQPLELPGWKSRAGAPAEERVRVMIFHGDEDGDWDFRRHPVGVDVHLRIIGPHHQPLILRAEIPDHLTL